LKNVKPFKSYGRNSETKPGIWSFATGFSIITFERVKRFCSSKGGWGILFLIAVILRYHASKSVESFKWNRFYQTERQTERHPSYISPPSRAIKRSIYWKSNR
jgi:hypothetical protein